MSRRRSIESLFIRLFGCSVLTLIIAHMLCLRDQSSSTQRKTLAVYSSCKQEYDRVASKWSLNLSDEVLQRSKMYMGNRYRLAKLARNLQKKPVHIVVCGGSITLGHGVHPESRYSSQLESWMNSNYPNHNHTVLTLGSHGADMCAMAKRMNLLDLPNNPDLFVLEFGVNDYQGQDHKLHLDPKTDVFFDGFQNIAICAEVVVHKLLTDYPDAAVLFLEFQTAVLSRKTAQLLHIGVAQHYQIPVLSYAEALFPDFVRLMKILEPYNYSIPVSKHMANVQPYPHGCAECLTEDIAEQFRGKGCRSLCFFMERSGYHNGPCDTTGKPCFVPFFAHDAVHPSVVGHKIAAHLVAHFIAETSLLVCQGRTFPEPFLPTHSGWLVGGQHYQDELRARSNFDLVKDTMDIFAKRDQLDSHDHSRGFELKNGDHPADRIGWIATNPLGGEHVSFEIDLPRSNCYVINLSALRSYESVGTFSVEVWDELTDTTTQTKTFDCKWKPRISIPVDFQVTSDDVPQCTGKCRVTVRTHPKIKGRKINKVKIVSLAVRECMAGPRKK